MAKRDTVEPEHLEMERHPRSGTWLVKIKQDSLARWFNYPPSPRILELAELAGLKSVDFNMEPARPEGANHFILFIEAGSTARQRERFLAKLEAESAVSLRKFSTEDLAIATRVLAQSPLYEVTVGGERRFVPILQAGGFLNHSWVPGQPVGDLVLELVCQKLTLRAITDEEKSQINLLADEISDSK